MHSDLCPKNSHENAIEKIVQALFRQTDFEDDQAVCKHGEDLFSAQKNAQIKIKEMLKIMDRHLPCLKELHPFYKKLIDVLFDENHFKEAVEKVSTTRSNIYKLYQERISQISQMEDQQKIKISKQGLRAQVYQMFNKVEEDLQFLSDVNQFMHKFSPIKTQIRTAVICGRPNVGKSSLFNRFSNKPSQVQFYPFTTQSLASSFIRQNPIFQIIDSPPLMKNKIQEMNSLEMLTISAIQYLPCIIVYMLDASQTCGFPLGDQIMLLDSIVRKTTSPEKLIVVFNKSDLLRMNTSKGAQKFIQRLNDEKITYLSISAEKGENIKEFDEIMRKKLEEEKFEISPGLSFCDFKMQGISHQKVNSPSSNKMFEDLG